MVWLTAARPNFWQPSEPFLDAMSGASGLGVSSVSPRIMIEVYCVGSNREQIGLVIFTADGL